MNDKLWNSITDGTAKVSSDTAKTSLIKEVGSGNADIFTIDACTLSFFNVSSGYSEPAQRQ